MTSYTGTAKVKEKVSQPPTPIYLWRIVMTQGNTLCLGFDSLCPFTLVLIPDLGASCHLCHLSPVSQAWALFCLIAF